VRAALRAAAELPEDVWVSVNASPALAGRPDLMGEALASAPRPVVVEIAADADTEPAVWEAVLAASAELAVDDVGDDEAARAVVSRLKPSYLKLSRTTVTGIEIDAQRQTYVGTLVAMADEHGCEVIATGVETEGERRALVDAGVRLGQGYLLGRPTSVARARTALPSRRSVASAG
jgi:EAL domain-containing protein (putative c-di-GMP-specific phosphodiesterase class I)